MADGDADEFNRLIEGMDGDDVFADLMKETAKELGYAEEDKKGSRIGKVELEAPEMTWALIGVPIGSWGDMEPLLRRRRRSRAPRSERRSHETEKFPS